MKYVCVLLLTWLAACSSRTSTSNYLANGNDHFAQNRYNEALSMYRKAIEKDPMSGEAYYRAGLAAMKLGKLDEAVHHLERAVGLLPDNLDAHRNLADVYLFVYGADERVRKEMQVQLESLSATLHQRFPKSYEDLRVRAYLALFSSDMSAALEHFAAADQMRPFDPNLTLAYMEALQSSGKAPLGEQVAKKAIEHHPDALALYDSLLRQYVRSNRPADAENILRLKTTNNPRNADAYLQLAAWYFNANRHSEMEKTVAQVSGNKKDFPAAPLQTGDFYVRIGMLPPALEQYQHGVAAGGDLKRMCQKRIVDALVKQRRTGEAEQLVQALRADKLQDAESTALEASVMLAKGQERNIQSALKLFQSVLSQMPDDFVLRYQYARALLLSRDVGAAVTQCEEALRLRADYLWPRVVLAHIAIEGGRFGIASTLIGEIRANPGMSVPFETAGQRPQEQPQYALLLGIKASSAGVLNELNAKLEAKRRELDQDLDVAQRERRENIERQNAAPPDTP